jgi:hypothetical protein
MHIIYIYILSLSAYKHGNAEYVLGSTHPTSEDYLKFIEEQKATLKSGKTK